MSHKRLKETKLTKEPTSTKRNVIHLASEPEQINCKFCPRAEFNCIVGWLEVDKR